MVIFTKTLLMESSEAPPDLRVLARVSAQSADCMQNPEISIPHHKPGVSGNIAARQAAS